MYVCGYKWLFIVICITVFCLVKEVLCGICHIQSAHEQTCGRFHNSRRRSHPIPSFRASRTSPFEQVCSSSYLLESSGWFSLFELSDLILKLSFGWWEKTWGLWNICAGDFFRTFESYWLDTADRLRHLVDCYTSTTMVDGKIVHYWPEISFQCCPLLGLLKQKMALVCFVSILKRVKQQKSHLY